MSPPTMSTEFQTPKTPSEWTGGNCEELFSLPACRTRHANDHFYNLKCRRELWQHIVRTHFNNVGTNMMNCEGMTHSSWVQQLNGDDKPDIRVELDSTWRDEVGTLHKTVKTPFEIYGDGDYTEIKEAGVILANSLAFDEGAQDIMDRNKHAWHLASESFLNTRAGEKLIGECGGCTFDGTATQGAGRSIILHFPSLCDTNLSDPDLSNKGLYRKFTEDGLSSYVPASQSRRSSNLSGGQSRHT